MNHSNHHFKWEGITPAGIKSKGVILATSKKSAIKILSDKDILVIYIRKKHYLKTVFQSKHLSNTQRLDFTQSLYWFLKTSTPLPDALCMTAKSFNNPATNAIIPALQKHIQNGGTLYQALSKHPKSFPTLFRKLIQIGEKTGCLDATLKQLIIWQEQKNDTKKKIIKAISYPMSMIIITLIITLGLLIFVTPQFQQIYQSFHAKLPALTQCIINISHHIISHPIALILLPFATLTCLFYLAVNSPFIRNKCLSFFITLPLVRQYIVISNLAQWSQTLSITLNSGTSFLEALSISNQAITNPMFHHEMKHFEQQLLQGSSIKAAIETLKLLPDRAKHMMILGDNADSLDMVMTKLSVIYNNILSDQLDCLSKVIEPVIMIGVAAGIAALIIAMYLPIFRMGNIM